MLKFKRSDIDNWREEFKKRKYPQQVAHIDSRSIEYFVLPRKVFQGVPNGLFRMTGDFQDGYLIGVSAEVPTSIRPHFAVSEHDEFMVYGLSDRNRTFHAEQSMMRLLDSNPSLQEKYIRHKLTLYDYMLEHARGNLPQWHFTRADYQGFQRAVAFLRKEQS